MLKPLKLARSWYSVLMIFSLIAGNGFYDGNEYDDGFAEFTGERI